MASPNPSAIGRPTAGMRPSVVPTPVPSERRRRPRAGVHWPVLLFRNVKDGDTVQTTTRDLSSSGFYCFSEKPFALGESLQCALHVPAGEAGGGDSRLECRVVVVRVEENALDRSYGIAFRTEDYRIAGYRLS